MSHLSQLDTHSIHVKPKNSNLPATLISRSLASDLMSAKYYTTGVSCIVTLYHCMSYQSLIGKIALEFKTFYRLGLVFPHITKHQLFDDLT